jgi:hypothetical protein
VIKEVEDTKEDDEREGKEEHPFFFAVDSFMKKALEGRSCVR